jgi:hypothetical protein
MKSKQTSMGPGNTPTDYNKWSTGVMECWTTENKNAWSIGTEKNGVME